MSCEELKNIVDRLEKVTTKLESISCKKGSAGDDENTELADALNEIIKKSVTEFVELSKKIGTDVGEASLLMKKAFITTMELMKIVGSSKKPNDTQMANVLKPIVDNIQEINEFATKNFKSQFKSHLEAISGYSACFGWISAPGKPHTYISQSIESGLFYSNRVITQFKEKSPDHKTFALLLKKCFEDLKEYTQEHHNNGCSWNMKGKDYSVTTNTTTTQVKSTTQASPTKSSIVTVSPTDIFASINKGTAISSGLRKVDDSMKTHKNPSLRAGATVIDSDKAKSVSKTTTTTTVKPPQFELMGKKWIIDNQLNNEMLIINEGDISYTVSIFNSKNSNFMVEPKMNSVSLEKCNNCKIQLKCGLISFIEVTNCKKVEIHADEILPFVNINSCDGIQIYLNSKSKEAQVSTNTSTGINVCYWSEETDLIEYPVPELFVSFIKDNKLITEIAKNA